MRKRMASEEKSCAGCKSAAQAKMLKSKSGLSFYVIIFSFFKMFILMVVMFALVLLIRTFIIATVDVSGAESAVFFQTIVTSPNGISYKDPVTERVYLNLINVDRFSGTEALENQLNSVFSTGENKEIGAKFSILDTNTEKLFEYNGKALSPVYYHKDLYSRWIVLAKSNAKGPGGAKEFIIRQDIILVSDKDKSLYKPALLEASITIPNS
jgi:hypothetical protein